MLSFLICRHALLTATIDSNFIDKSKCCMVLNILVAFPTVCIDLLHGQARLMRTTQEAFLKDSSEDTGGSASSYGIQSLFSSIATSISIHYKS